MSNQDAQSASTPSNEPVRVQAFWLPVLVKAKYRPQELKVNAPPRFIGRAK